tara:strand:- start:1389 stop:2231 length:843 start_codon:yes stop_codon:yes gene_type:complete
MKDVLFDLNNVRIEISFKSIEELRSILSFYQTNNLYKINIPCKNTIKKDFLLNSIKISRKEFPNIDVIPHFSILHEFNRNRINTQASFINFLQFIKHLGCKEVLLVSGSQKKKTLDSLSTLSFLRDNPLFDKSNFSIGVAFNPYLHSHLFDEEIDRLIKKLNSGIVKSIWIQFGTDCTLLHKRIEILKDILNSSVNSNSEKSNIAIFGSILIPSKQFLARFKYRPWKGVYCSSEFLESVDFGINLIREILGIYKRNKICPIIETSILTSDQLNILKVILD